MTTNRIDPDQSGTPKPAHQKIDPFANEALAGEHKSGDHVQDAITGTMKLLLGQVQASEMLGRRRGMCIGTSVPGRPGHQVIALILSGKMGDGDVASFRDLYTAVRARTHPEATRHEFVAIDNLAKGARPSLVSSKSVEDAMARCERSIKGGDDPLFALANLRLEIGGAS